MAKPSMGSRCSVPGRPVTRGRGEASSSGSMAALPAIGVAALRGTKKTKYARGPRTGGPYPASKRTRTTNMEAVCGTLEGSVYETESEHRRRHPDAEPGWRRKCARCAFMALRQAGSDRHGAAGELDLLAGYAAVDRRTQFGDLGKSFLVERPMALRGAWAYGCCVCAAARAAGGETFAQFRGGNKWARYAVTRVLASRALGYTAIRNHAATAFHRAAVLLAHRPHFHLALSPHAPATVLDRSDFHVQRGAVPQVLDWRDAWAEATTSMSYNKQQQVSEKKLGTRPGCLRKQRRKLVRIMAAVARRATRATLKAATSITVALDARGRFYVIRVRCDTPGPPYVHDTVLGVMRARVVSLEEECTDHGKQHVAALTQFFISFFTDLVDGFDESAFTDVCGKVRCLTSDGAAAQRKALFSAAGSLFPNTMLVIRDMAHAVRIAAKTPLHMDDMFGVVWKELFDSKDALVPMIQNSEKLREMFANIQERVLRIPAEKRPMDVVLRHLSFAKQRFDSFADPCAKLSVMLLPVCVLLAFIGSDERNTPVRRKRAAVLLKLFTPKFCMALGMSADYGLLCVEFLRQFDCLGHDIARSVSELREFEATLDAVFRKGLVFLSPRRAHQAGLTATESKNAFCTEWVRAQTARGCVFQAGADCVHTWGRVSPEDAKDLADRSHVMVDALLARVHADYDVDQLRRAAQCFDLATITNGFHAGDRDNRRDCLNGVRVWAEAAKQVDVVRAVLEYRDVVPVLSAQYRKLREQPGLTGDHWSNTAVWSLFLAPTFRAEHLPTRVAPFTALPGLVRVYFSVLDGECAVERDLGMVTDEMQEHCNLESNGLDDLMVVKNFWSRDMLWQEHQEVLPCVTPRLRDCILLWRSVYGARFGLYDRRKPNTNAERQPGLTGSAGSAADQQNSRTRGRKRGTFRAFRAGVIAEGRDAVRRASKLRRIGDTVTSYGGMPISSFQHRPNTSLRQSPFWNPAMERFHTLTLRKREQARAAAGRRVLRGSLWPTSTPRTAGPAAPRLEDVRAVCYVDAPEQFSHTVRTATGVHAGKTADMAVVRSFSSLAGAMCGERVVHLLYIVALGRRVVTSRVWSKAHGCPSAVRSSEVLGFRPAAERVAATMAFEPAVCGQAPALVAAFKHCAGIRGSKWKVLSPGARRPAGTKVFAGESDVVTWLHTVKACISRAGGVAMTDSGRAVLG